MPRRRSDQRSTDETKASPSDGGPESAPTADSLPSSLVVAAGARWLSSRPRLLLATRLAELGAAVALALVTLHPGTPGAASALCGIVVASLSWLIWILAEGRRRTTTGALVLIAAGGGVTVATRAAGLFYVGVSASGAAFAFDLPIALALVGPAATGWAITSAAEGWSARRAYQAAAIAALGLVSGTGRRQLIQHGRQTALLATAEQRAAVAREEADLLAERNRLGREVHDVLAHTLGAVSIQLTALDSRVAAGDGAAVVRERIAAIHRLVGDGLGEAGDAVRALRESEASLDDQLQRLCDLHGADFELRGRAGGVAAQASLALYRAVQEALTNVDKHAPHAPVAVRLEFSSAAVDVRVDNARPPRGPASPLADSGAGQGLRGMSERLGLVGGRVDAGPTDDGWRVHATVPRR